MKHRWLIVAALALPAAAMAVPPAQQPAAPQTNPERQLEQAQQALQQAAAQVAALSLQTFGDQFGTGMRDMHIAFGWARLGLNVRRAADGGWPVQAVTPDSPADRGGIVAGDRLTSLNGIRLVGRQPAHGKLLDLLAGLRAGGHVTLTFEHNGKTRQATLTAQDPFDWVQRFAERAGTMAAMQADMAARQGAIAAKQGALAAARASSALRQADDGAFAFMLGWPGRWDDMKLASLTPQLGEYFGTQTGLLVVRAPHDDALGLKDGDVILKIGDRVPRSPIQAVRILRSYAPGDSVTLDIMRDRKPRELKVTLPQQNAVKNN